jgi:hypothetical protein
MIKEEEEKVTLHDLAEAMSESADCTPDGAPTSVSGQNWAAKKKGSICMLPPLTDGEKEMLNELNYQSMANYKGEYLSDF